MRKKSRKWSITEFIQWIIGVPASGAATVRALDASNIEATKTYVDTIKGFVTEYGVELFIVFCLLAFIGLMLIKKYMKDDVQESRATPSGETDAAS